jgi:hemerythrin-like domain-containing protein
MLQACHERLQRMLGLLMRLLNHLQQHGVDAQGQAAARDIMRYFDLSGPAHHEDEERHVLPALRSDSRPEAHDWARRIHEDHLEMTRQWGHIRQDLQQVIDTATGSSGSAASPPGMTQRWQDFERLYLTHMALEDSCAYPFAASKLSPEQTAAMGEEMATRRGVRSVAAPLQQAAQDMPKRLHST